MNADERAELRALALEVQREAAALLLIFPKFDMDVFERVMSRSRENRFLWPMGMGPGTVVVRFERLDGVLTLRRVGGSRDPDLVDQIDLGFHVRPSELRSYRERITALRWIRTRLLIIYPEAAL